MILYVAGPMTGYPDWNHAAFNDAAARLVEVGHIALNPARHGLEDSNDPTMTWADYLRRDIPDVLSADGIALLLGWEASRGAQLEVHIAEALGLVVQPVQAWLA